MSNDEPDLRGWSIFVSSAAAVTLAGAMFGLGLGLYSGIRCLLYIVGAVS